MLTVSVGLSDADLRMQSQAGEGGGGGRCRTDFRRTVAAWRTQRRARAARRGCTLSVCSMRCVGAFRLSVCGSNLTNGVLACRASNAFMGLTWYAGISSGRYTIAPHLRLVWCAMLWPSQHLRRGAVFGSPSAPAARHRLPRASAGSRARGEDAFVLAKTDAGAHAVLLAVRDLQHLLRAAERPP